MLSFYIGEPGVGKDLECLSRVWFKKVSSAQL